MDDRYEIICDECSKTFISEDINANICPDCWEKLVCSDLENEGEGKLES